MINLFDDALQNFGWYDGNIGSGRCRGSQLGSFGGRRLFDQRYSMVSTAYPDQSASISLTHIVMVMVTRIVIVIRLVMVIR
jgi:hypothetical protein